MGYKNREVLSIKYPGTILFEQFATVSIRNGRNNFPLGGEVYYQQVSFDDFQDELLLSLATLINTELEIPSFSPQSPKPLPYPAGQFLDLFLIKNAVTLLAWRKLDKQTDPTLVGYLVGGPYVNYPDHLKFTEQDVQPENIALLSEKLHLPSANSWLFDSFAVRPDQRGLQIGKILLDLMIQHVLFSNRKWSEIATFAVDHKTSWTRDMLLNSSLMQSAKLAVDRRVPYRNKYAYYMVFDILPSGL